MALWPNVWCANKSGVRLLLMVAAIQVKLHFFLERTRRNADPANLFAFQQFAFSPVEMTVAVSKIDIVPPSSLRTALLPSSPELESLLPSTGV